MAMGDAAPRPEESGALASDSGTRSKEAAAVSATQLGIAVPDPEELSAGYELQQVANRFRLKIGDIVPGTHYRLERWLGEGSMGVVFEARHTEIGRRVALKILNPAMSRNEDAVDAFREEARASARIGAANIVDVLDFTTLPDGRVAMAMEFLEGHTMLGMVGSIEPIDPGRLIGILRQVCKGLGFAHKAGIVHRDIKPENVMLVEREGRRDFAKIVDFGISSMLGKRGRSGVGTPLYMSPEVILGLEVDGRADIYSVGCMAYELLCGQPPYFDPSVEKVLELHLTGTAARPSSRVKDGRTIPTALEKVIMRCLAHERDKRYRDMADLEAALCEAQISAGLHSTWDDLPAPEVDPDRKAKIIGGMPDPAGRRRQSRLLPALLGAAAAAAIALAWVQLRDEEPVAIPAQATSEIDALAGNAQRAAAQALFVYPPTSEPDKATAYSTIMQLEKMEGPEKDAALEKAEALRSQFAGTLVRLGDEYWEKDGGKAFAIDYYAQALMFEPEHQRARERASFTPGELAELRRKATDVDFTEAELVAVEALAVLADQDEESRTERLEKLRTKRGKRSVSTEANLDSLMGTKSANSTSPEPAEKSTADEASGTTGGALDLEEKAADPAAAAAEAARRKNEAVELADQADQARRAGNLGKAESLYHQALRADSKNLQAITGLGDVFFDRGKYSRSAKYRRMAANRSPRDAQFRLKLGDAYFKSLEYEDALRQYEKAKDLGSAAAEGRIAKVEKKTGN